MPIGRRQALRLAFGCGAAISLSGAEALGAPAQALIQPQNPFDFGHPGKLSPRAIRLVETSNTVDMLCGVRRNLTVKDGPNTVALIPQRFMSWFEDPSSITDEQLRRYFKSGIDIFYIGADLGQLVADPDPYSRANYFFNGWRKIAAAHPDKFGFVLQPSDLERDHDRGKLKIILGLQNGDHFRTADDVAHFYGLGQRVSQLTYNQETPLGGGAFSDAGLKPLGEQVIHAMNKAGMVLDLAHANDKTALAAADTTAVTPIISHTNCRALNPGFNRDVPDEVIRAFAAKGGVIGMTVVRQFVTAQEPTTIEDYINQIDHVANLVGVEHVGIGGDTDLWQQDGIDEAAKKAALAAVGQEKYRWRDRTEIDGLDHPRRIYDICEGLVRRGYSDEHIRMVLGGNWRRVLAHIWSTRT